MSARQAETCGISLREEKNMAKWPGNIQDLKETGDLKEQISGIYDLFHEEERFRSKAGQVEFLTTVGAVESVLKPGMALLDIGAGTGAYSRKFARQGIRVTAVELARRNIQQFRELTDPNLAIHLMEGNALDLSCLPAESFDVVLLLGPLYHLSDHRDRLRAVMEARRVLKPDGTIFCAFINHDMVPMTETMHNPQWFAQSTYDPARQRVADFPFVFHTLEEGKDLIESCDLSIRRILASDGFSELLAPSVNAMGTEAYENYLQWHLTHCESSSLVSATNHFLFQATQDRSIDIKYPEEPEVAADLAEFCAKSVRFDDFIRMELKSGMLSLRLTRVSPAMPDKGWVPAYYFDICLGDEVIGSMDLRIGYHENLFYGGNIGYSILPAYRGHGYAAEACRLLIPLAKAHDMESLAISNELRNHASMRVCQKLGAQYLRTVALPESFRISSEMPQYYENQYRWQLTEATAPLDAEKEKE